MKTTLTQTRYGWLIALSLWLVVDVTMAAGLGETVADLLSRARQLSLDKVNSLTTPSPPAVPPPASASADSLLRVPSPGANQAIKGDKEGQGTGVSTSAKSGNEKSTTETKSTQLVAVFGSDQHWQAHLVMSGRVFDAAVGDLVMGWRVETITPHQVELRQGKQSLRLTMKGGAG